MQSKRLSTLKYFQTKTKHICNHSVQKIYIPSPERFSTGLVYLIMVKVVQKEISNCYIVRLTHYINIKMKNE